MAPNLRQAWQQRGRAVIISDLCSKHTEKNFLPKLSFPSCGFLHLPGAGSAQKPTQTNPDLVKDSDKGGSDEVKILQEEILGESPGVQVGIPSHSSLPTCHGGHTWTISFAHQGGSGSSHTVWGWNQVPAALPTPEPPLLAQIHLPVSPPLLHGMTQSWNTLGQTEFFPTGRFPNTFNTSCF